MARPGRYEAAAYAARQALQCHGTPGSLRSFAQHTLGRAFEAQGDKARVERALDACRQHFGSAQAAYSAVSQIDEVAGRFPQVAGMTFTVDPSADAGSRISDVTVSGMPLDPEKTYGVVSNNYVRNGGDGYEPFKTAQNAYDYGPDLADVTAEFIAANGAYTPYTDGRITVK